MLYLHSSELVRLQILASYLAPMLLPEFLDQLDELRSRSHVFYSLLEYRSRSLHQNRIELELSDYLLYLCVSYLFELSRKLISRNFYRAILENA